MSPRFCTNCGAPRVEGHRFCGRCGQPLQYSPAQAWTTGATTEAGVPSTAPMASPQRQETVLGIVAVGRPKGLMGMRYDSYNMIVTPTRLVFAYVSPELMKDATRRAREEAKQKGKGLLGQWGAQLGWLGRLHDDYRAMTVDVILNRYPGSFAIPNGQVRRVRFVRTGDEQGGRTSDELILRTGEGKLRFKLLSANLAQVRALLRQTLPGVA